MKKKSKVLIIDGQNMVYRALYKYGSLKNSKGLGTGIVYGVPCIIGALLKTQLPDYVIIVFDSDRDEKRLKILPSYKGSRGEKKIGFDYDDYFRQVAELKLFLTSLGIPYFFQKGKEADDIIWLTARRLKRKHNVMIVSSDKDFDQLISNNVCIWNPKMQARITHKNCFELKGYNPENCVDYLTLVGDESDNIIGMNGIGKVRAKAFFAKGLTIKDYLTTNIEPITGMDKRNLEGVFLRNNKLIDIRVFVRKYMSLRDVSMVVPFKGLNKIEVMYLSSNHQITTFGKEEFLNPFKHLAKRSNNNKLLRNILKINQ